MHLKRWITGIIAAPVLIWLIGIGPRWAFYSTLCLVSIVGLMEFYGMTSPRLPKSLQCCIYAITLLFFFLVGRGSSFLAQGLIPFFAFVPMAFFMFTYAGDPERSSGNLGNAVAGPIYITLPLSLLLWIDRYPEGSIWIFFVLAVVFASDTGAFYFGRLFGDHKLYKAVSPGKTWEGAIGGLLSGICASFVFSRLIQLHRSDLSVAILAVCLSVAGQIGDLAESMLKRSHGVKDSGHILPGHGGILDRIDGLLFAIPVMHGYLWLFMR